MVRRLASVALVVLPLVVVVAACKEDEARPPAAGDGTGPPPRVGGSTSSEGGVTVDAATDADTTCTSIPITGQVVDRIGVVGDAPARTGGTITDGRYDLTDYSQYVGLSGVGGPTGVTAQSTIVVANGRIEQAIRFGGAAPSQEVRTLSTFTATGSTLLVTNLCPSSGSASQYQYNANDAQILLNDTATKEQFTFTKR